MFQGWLKRERVAFTKVLQSCGHPRSWETVKKFVFCFIKLNCYSAVDTVTGTSGLCEVLAMDNFFESFGSDHTNLIC